MFLLVPVETWFLRRTLGSIQKKFRIGPIYAGGIPKGASPLCVVAEEGVTGEKPHRKGFSLRACFCLLFPRGKSRSGCGAEGPMVLRAQPPATKKPLIPIGDERLTFRGTTRIRARGARSCPCNGGPPSRSHGPLPGEPRDTLQGGFQPVAASLWGWQTPYFPVPRMFSTVTYTIEIICWQGGSSQKFFPCGQILKKCTAAHLAV